MSVPFCDTPECELHKIEIEPNINVLTINGIKKKRKAYYDSVMKKGYYYCEKCFLSLEKEPKKQSGTEHITRTED